MEKSLWLKNLTMAIEANTSIKPNIIGLLSAGNEEKVSHENSQGFSPLWLTVGGKEKALFFFPVWQQTRYWQCHCTKTFSGHHIELLASFFHWEHLFDFPHKKQKQQKEDSLYPVLWHLHSYITTATETSSRFKRTVCQCDWLVLPPYNT